MKFLKKTKLITTAILLGLPLAPILSDNHETKATPRIGGAINKVGNAARPLMKPPLPPKPTNIPKVPSHITAKLNANKFTSVGTPKGNVNQKITAFNNNKPSNGKAMGPIAQRVQELNLTANLPEAKPQINSKHGAVNSAINNLKKQDSSFQKQNNSKKLNLNSDFKNKLEASIGGGGKQNLTQKPNQQPGKLNMNNDAKQKLEGIFGGGNQSTNKTPSSNSQSFQNNNPNIPDAPPLPPSMTPNANIPPAPPLPPSMTPNSNIPPAPPLPPSNSIPPAPPLPNKKPLVTTTTSGGNLQNQLSSKLNSLNKTEGPKKQLNTGNSTAHDSLMAELQAKFNSKK